MCQVRIRIDVTLKQHGFLLFPASCPICLLFETAALLAVRPVLLASDTNVFRFLLTLVFAPTPTTVNEDTKKIFSILSFMYLIYYAG